MFDTKKFIEDCGAVKAKTPLVHNITNYVAMDVAANALLAIGASPLMSFFTDEMEEIAGISSALAVNIGCLDKQEIKAMEIAAETMHKFGKPWVIDPVGAGASKVRTETAVNLILKYKPTIIRGNASEIACVAAAVGCKPEDVEEISGRGVDSTMDTTQAAGSAIALARKTGSVVSVSGPTDFITDGDRIGTISNGSPVMPKITALGCTSTAIHAAFAAVEGDAFRAALNAAALMGVAGELAEKEDYVKGTGTFKVALMDELSSFDAEEYATIVKE